MSRAKVKGKKAKVWKLSSTVISTEAQYARTRSEFYSTAKISLREAGETVWWLELLKGTNNPQFSAEIDGLIQDGNELCKIFASISLKNQK